MATENKRITVGELDFDQIKANLKQYLRGQSEFSDYDFEGSGLSILLNILAYNTHYNMLYNNMAINEVFLDTATKRSSVVSRANEIGYVPRSATCSQAIINISVSNTTTSTAPTSITIPKNTPFSTNLSGAGYTFYTTEELIAINNGSGVYDFGNVIIKEGKPLTYKYTVADGMRYIIPNINVDTNTLTVRVQDSSSSSNYVTFARADSLINVSSTDNVYFLKEIENELFELTFGDGVIGKQLSNGNIIHIDYLISSLDAPNGSRAFTYNGGSLSGGIVTLITISPAYNGASVESIDSIKYNAPRVYTTQNRAVTSSDYRSLIYTYFPDARAVSVWGGETEVVPQYGKVFISIVPNDVRLLSVAEKNFILNDVLAPRKTLSITPIIVDPVFTRIGLNVSYYYNPHQTVRTSSDLTSIIYQTIVDYNNETLNMFGSVFKHSHLSRMIDSSEESITSNITTLKIHRDITPIFNVSSPYIINMGNPIYNSGVPEESVILSGFYISSQENMCFIDDVPTEGSSTGTLRMFYYNSSGQKVALMNVGTINYNTGIIFIDALNITAINGDRWEVIAKLQSNDIASSQNHFVQIDETLLTITPVIDYPNQSYTFTSSRN